MHKKHFLENATSKIRCHNAFNIFAIQVHLYITLNINVPTVTVK